MVPLQDRKLAGYPHLDAKRVTKRVLEANVVEDRTITLLIVGRNKPFSASNFERQRLVELLLCWNLSRVPVLPGSGMRDPAGAPSSSSGMEGPQPMAVEPDPMVRRGLKRATEGDLEISEICSWISDVNANEEPHPQVPVGEFTDEEEWQALSAELAHLDEFDAKKDIPRDQAPGPLLIFTWVRTVKNGAPNYRLCLLLFGRQSERCKESLYCPTPGPQIYQMLIVLAAHHGLECEVFRHKQDVPAHTHQNSCVRQSTRRLSESNSWWCLGNDQNCVLFTGGTR